MNDRQLAQLLQQLVRHLTHKTSGFKRIVAIAVVVIVVIAYLVAQPSLEAPPTEGSRTRVEQPGSTGSTSSSQDKPRKNSSQSARAPTRDASADEAILEAFRGRQGNVIVQGKGTVKKLLPDDEIVDRHQKMIIRLASGHTLLLAHNIDLAKRVPVETGDEVEFRGEYEYSEAGGVVHWTHHDPGGRHADGWIRLQGTTYQ